MVFLASCTSISTCMDLSLVYTMRTAADPPSSERSFSMDVQPAADNTTVQEHDRLVQSSTALVAFAATTCVLGLATVLVFSFRGGSISVSNATTSLTVAVNPPQ
jgi:hypothetical protein